MRHVVLMAALGAMALSGLARADEPVPIGEVVADPDTYHFRMVSLQGTVRQVTTIPPYKTDPDTACYGAYTFTLEDQTGSMEISVLGICGRPFTRTPEVAEGETILLVAQIFSPNHMASSSQDEVKRLRAVANQITHLPSAGPPPDEAAPGPSHGADAPAEASRPAPDGAY